jgi:lariat debranching enzyme
MTLYNRPQICFTPDLQPEWLLALVCIFVGCICITTTIILLASSHWDRNVVPYARWVGFTASEYSSKSSKRSLDEVIYYVKII